MSGARFEGRRPEGRPLRAAVVGTRWGLVHVEALRASDVEVVALCGRDARKTEAIAAAHDIPVAATCLASLHTMELDLVAIATPAETHAQVSAELPETARICEKPVLGLSGRVEELGQLGSSCWVNYAFSFLPGARQMADALESEKPIRRFEMVTEYDIPREMTPAVSVLELASHPLSFAIHLLGAPRGAGTFRETHGGCVMSFTLGSTETTLRCSRERRGFALRHGVRAVGSSGIPHEFEGRLEAEKPWRFGPVYHGGDALPMRAGGAGDPWVNANVASIRTICRALRGELSEVAARRVGLFDASRAFSIEALVQSLARFP